MSKVIVIGGGAAGMMAALKAAENGHDVTLLEKNEKLGKKLFITGKGRCNVTNASDMETIMSQIVTNPRFLYSAFSDCSNTDVMELIENGGCPLKIERGQRVFPESDKSSDIISCFSRLLKKAGVEIILNKEVTHIITEEGRAVGVSLSDGKKNKRRCHSACNRRSFLCVNRIHGRRTPHGKRAWSYSDTMLSGISAS